MISITPTLSLPDWEVEFIFTRAAGPGGQNVNKVASAVLLRFDVRRSPTLTADVKTRLITLAGQRINTEGILIIRAQRYRTQENNKKDAMRRLVALIRASLTPPKQRHKTTVPKHVRARRLENKRRHGYLKAGRRRDLFEP